MGRDDVHGAEAHVCQGKEGRWTEELFKVLEETPEDVIAQRDLFDRPPSVLKSWASGNTVMIGDAVHPMMPNLGQGGCQSTEDGYRLGQELSQVQHTSEVSAALCAMVYISPASPHISPHLP